MFEVNSNSLASEKTMHSSQSRSAFEKALATDQTIYRLIPKQIADQQESTEASLEPHEFEVLSVQNSEEQAGTETLPAENPFLDSESSENADSQQLKDSQKAESKKLETKEEAGKELTSKNAPHQCVTSAVSTAFQKLTSPQGRLVFFPKEASSSLFSGKPSLTPLRQLTVKDATSEQKYFFRPSSKQEHTNNERTHSKALKEKETQQGLSSRESQEQKLVKELPSTPLQERSKEREKEGKERHSSHQDLDENNDEGRKKKQEEIESVSSIIGLENSPSVDSEGNTDYQSSLDILSNGFGTRVSPMDVLTIFFACLKLMIENRQQQKLMRQDERKFQVAEMEKVVSNYKMQGKWLLFSGITSGVMGMVSGLTPIVGHMKGDFILNKLQGIFSSLRGIQKDQFFKQISKMTFAMSEMNKSTGQIQNAFAEGDRTRAQHLSDIARTEGEECTRTLDEILQEWRSIESFLNQYLQMTHDTTRTLYS